MLKRIIYRLLERRHYWRYVSFSQVAELYASRALRLMAVTMVSVFVAIFLYQHGYRLPAIMLYFALYFMMRALCAFPVAFFIARYGPKHATLVSNFLYVPALLALTQLPDHGVWALAAYGLLQALSVTLYDISYRVNFSKVKSDENTGRELGYMQMIERIATSLSPVIGGAVAYIFSPEATLLLASGLFALAAGPLFFSSEPVKIRQRITFAGVPWRRIRSGMIAEVGAGTDVIVSGPLWSLFIAIAIFGTTDNKVYAELGALVSATMLVALVSAKIYGIVIDRRRGRQLLQTGIAADSLVHILRPFTSTPLGALLINILNEAATTAYAMPFAKGLFDMADRLPGYRIVYMTIMSASGSFGACLLAAIVGLISLLLHEVATLQIGFVIAAFAVWMIVLHGFPALTRRDDLSEMIY